MAIAGYNSVESTNNVPFNNDSGQVLNDGDMLYWNSIIQAFEAGPGITVPTNLSTFTNDANYVTDEQVTEMLANLASGGTLDLSDYATVDALNAALASVGPHFSGSYNDLTDKPTIPSTDGLATTAYVDSKVSAVPVFSGSYADLTNKPALFSGSWDDLTNRPILFSGDYNDLINTPDHSVFASTTYVDTAVANASVEGLTSDSATKTLTLDAGWNLVPATDSQQSLGSPTQRFTDIYIDNSTINIGDNELAADSNSNVTWNGEVLSTQSYVDNAVASALTGGTVDLSTYVTESELATALANYQPTIDLSTYALKTELFSGDYNDLVNAPTIPSLTGYATTTYVNNTVSSAVASALSSIDTSSYVTDLEMDTAIQTAVDAVPVFSGSYTDLVNKPTIFSGSYLDLTDRPVLFSGDYNDLVNTPDHSVYASTTYVDTQIATALSGGTIDLSSYVTDAELTAALTTISHPTLVSAFTNDADYITTAEVNTLLAGYQATVDLTNYYTKTEVDAQISAATLAAGGISNLDDLNDVAVGSLPQIDRADEFYLLEYNPVNQLWESRDFGNVFATQSYVSATVATALTSGSVNLDGYATEQFVEQKILETGIHFSGNYYDLVNRPTLFSGDYNDLYNVPAGNADLMLSLNGSYLQLINIDPEPDTLVSQVDLSGLATQLDYNDLQNLPNLFSGSYDDLHNLPTLFSGSYNDLANKPYIPSIAGLASEEYVDNRWAEPVITGDRAFTGSVVFEDFVQQKLSTVNSTSTKRELVLAVQTTNDIETEVLFSDASRVGIVSGTTAMFKATVVASSGADKTAFIVKGVIDYTGTLSIVGNNIVETISDSDLGWTANLTADTANEALQITVIGSAATTVDWTVFLEISEVIR